MGYAKKMTHDDFLEKFRDTRDDSSEYEFLERYQKSTIRIKTKHITCGHVWDAHPTNLTSNKTKCPKCSNRLKKTQDVFEKEVYELVGDEYNVIGLINGVNRKVGMFHTVCRTEYDVTPAKFLISGRRCPKCFGKHKKTNVQFVKEVHELVGDSYTPLTQYENNKHKVLMRHEVCKNEWMVEPNKFLNFDTKCPRCADESRHESARKTHEQFVKEVFCVAGCEYTILGEYSNFKTKVLMRHEECSTEYMVTPDSFLSANSRCPYCSSPKGEKEIARLLGSFGIEYEAQYKDDRCRNNLPLRFDFAIKKNEEVLGLIEYDGIQHFKPVEHWGGEESLIKQRAKDLIKDEFCESLSIPLLRIPYWKYDDIEVLVFDFLINYNIFEGVVTA